MYNFTVYYVDKQDFDMKNLFLIRSTKIKLMV